MNVKYAYLAIEGTFNVEALGKSNQDDSNKGLEGLLCHMKRQPC